MRYEILGLARQRGRQDFKLVVGKIRKVLDDLGILRMERPGEHRLAPFRYTMRHQNRLAAARRTVIHGGVRHIHTGDHRHHGLELEKILQRTLRDLRLIRRVGGQELRALDQMIDRSRNMMTIGARPGEEGYGTGGNILPCHAAENALHLQFAFPARQIDKPLAARAIRHVAEQVVDTFHANHAEHFSPVGFGQRQISHIPVVLSPVRGLPVADYSRVATNSA